MAVHPVADFGIRTYVALPITEHGTARNESEPWHRISNQVSRKVISSNA